MFFLFFLFFFVSARTTQEHWFWGGSIFKAAVGSPSQLEEAYISPWHTDSIAYRRLNPSIPRGLQWQLDLASICPITLYYLFGMLLTLSVHNSVHSIMGVMCYCIRTCTCTAQPILSQNQEWWDADHACAFVKASCGFSPVVLSQVY